MDATTWGMLGIIAVLLGGAIFVWQAVLRVSKDRLMRCPETGAITLVGVEHAATRDGDAVPVVRRCALWPQKAGCAQHCLDRYEDTPAGYPVSVDLLRPR